jgi:hypothetical protein
MKAREPATLKRNLGTPFWSYPFTKTESVAAGETRVDFRIAYDY